MAIIEKTAGQRSGTRYYRSFASYEIPFRPDEPTSYADTEGLASYYVALHDRDGRVVQFDKLSLVRVENQAIEFDLPNPQSADSTIYFEVVRDSSEAGPKRGKQIEYRDTEHLDEFLVGRVDATGRSGRAKILRRIKAFTDAYEYWPSGRLRKRTMSGPDLDPSIANFDPTGQPVTSPVSGHTSKTDSPNGEIVEGMTAGQHATTPG